MIRIKQGRDLTRLRLKFLQALMIPNGIQARASDAKQSAAGLSIAKGFEFHLGFTSDLGFRSLRCRGLGVPGCQILGYEPAQADYANTAECNPFRGSAKGFLNVWVVWVLVRGSYLSCQNREL